MTSSETRQTSGRERLLEAARQVFGERGYRGATTRDIAVRAGMTEPMIFRHFGSKALLFEEAAVAPVVSFMDTYVAEWGSRDHARREAVEEARDFFDRLVDVLAANRELLLAILAASEFDDALGQAARRVQDAFGRVIDMFASMVEAEFDLRGYVTADRPALVRVMLGLIVSIALHSDWLDVGTGAGQVARSRLVDEAARVIVHGVT